MHFELICEMRGTFGHRNTYKVRQGKKYLRTHDVITKKNPTIKECFINLKHLKIEVSLLPLNEFCYIFCVIRQNTGKDTINFMMVKQKTEKVISFPNCTHSILSCEKHIKIS